MKKMKHFFLVDLAGADFGEIGPKTGKISGHDFSNIFLHISQFFEI